MFVIGHDAKVRWLGRYFRQRVFQSEGAVDVRLLLSM
jgi:hypothetical protein